MDSGQSTDAAASRTSAAWEGARRYTTQLGRIPASFTTPIRTLLIDERNSAAHSPASQFLVTRLLKSPTMKAMFYYAALTYHHEKITNSAYLSSAELLRLFSPEEVAAVISIIFVYRKLGRLSRALPEEDWSPVVDDAEIRMEIGGHAGYAIKNVGAAKGMLTGGLDRLALGLFRLRDHDGLQSYLKHLQASGKEIDTAFEEERWGCTRYHVAANVLQMMGFGVAMTHSYLIGLASNPAPVDDKQDKAAYAFMIIEEWIQSLRKTGAEPARTHLGQYYPHEKDYYKLMYEINRLRDQSSKFHWLRRTHKDVNPHDTPQLFQEFLMTLQQSKALEEFYEQHLPAEVLNGLSPEDLNELTSTEDGESGI